MKTSSHKVSDSLYLIHQTLDSKIPAKPVEVPVNHVVAIDCSGSMSGDLPRIREQLKKKLPKILREKDTLSIIWFSGRGEFGTLLEAEPVASLADLKAVNMAIDRWIKPVGMTGFKEPVEEATKLVERVSKKHKDGVFSLFFMSDGCDNQWSRPDLLKAVEKAAGSFSSATFVEYGYYADRPLLTAMAEKAGGVLIFSEDFDRYAPAFELAMQRKCSGAPRIEVKVKGDIIGGFAFALSNGELYSFEAASGSVLVPEDLKEIYYLAPRPEGSMDKDIINISKGGSEKILDSVYAAISLFSLRMKPNVVYPMLRAMGDVRFIESFSGCFGKQKYSEFMESAKEAAFGKGRLTKGWDPKKVPREDAFTVLDLLRLLSEDDDNKILFDHPAFKYSRIGRGRIDSSEILSADQIEEVRKITEEIANERDAKKVKALNERIAAITANKGEALKFIADPAPDGYSISSLTLNEERPNISVLVRKTGTVDISSRLPKDTGLAKIPTAFKTFIFRNYSVVKDGLINLKTLPMKLSKSTRAELETRVKMGDIPTEALSIPADEPGTTLISLEVLPIINRKMVQETSAKYLFEKEYDLVCARAAQKVFNAYKKEHFPKKSEGFAILYGDKSADWLKEQGFTDYSGFSPKGVLAESTDFYVGKELSVSLKGLSSLPSLKDVKDRMAKNKLTAGASLMAPYVKEVDAFLDSDIYKKAPNKNDMFETWLDGKTKDATTKVRRLLFELAQVKFSIIVGQVWFTDLKTLDDTELTLILGGEKIDCKVEMKEVHISI